MLTIESHKQAAWYLALLDPAGWRLESVSRAPTLWVIHRDVPELRMLYETFRRTWPTVPTAKSLWETARTLNELRPRP